MAVGPARVRTWRLCLRGFVLFFLVGLAACATPPQAEHPSSLVRIGPGLFLALPQPGELGRAVEAAQLVTARYSDQTYLFESRLSAADGRFTFVAFDTMGRRAMTVTWTETGVLAETASWLPAGLRPENLLADMVVIYWPEATVRRSLTGGDLVSSATSRAVIASGRETIRVDYYPTANDPWNGRLQFRNIAWDYALDIQSRVTP